MIIRVVAELKDYEIDVDEQMSIALLIEYFNQYLQDYHYHLHGCYHHIYQNLDLHKKIKDYQLLEYEIVWMY